MHIIEVTNILAFFFLLLLNSRILVDFIFLNVFLYFSNFSLYEIFFIIKMFFRTYKHITIQDGELNMCIYILFSFKILLK